MPQSKYNCKKCRRLVSLTSPTCPFCNTPNPYYQQPVQTTPQNPVTPTPKKDSNISSPSSNAGANNQEPVNHEISIEDMESMYHDPVPVRQDALKPSAQTIPETGEPEQNDGGLEPEPDPAEDVMTERETNKISSSSEAHRSPINWKDERDRDTSGSYTEMFNENGIYQANYDGYYNDTLPKIQGEIDRILAGREKAVLKVVFTIIVIFAIIVYLILTI